VTVDAPLHPDPVQAADGAALPSPARQSRGPLRWLGMPMLLAAVGVALYAYVSSQGLDSIEQRVLNGPALVERVVERVQLSLVSTVLVIAVAVPLGTVATRQSTRRISPLVLALGNLGQANDLQQVDPALVRAARGMGMSPVRVLRQVELPLAVPVVLAGIRTALIINVGTATLATFFGVQALGYVIFQGIQLNRDVVLITGAVLASGLALLADDLAGVVEELLSPRGL
jgi:osmoprotectant transport system permease protein